MLGVYRDRITQTRRPEPVFYNLYRFVVESGRTRTSDHVIPSDNHCPSARACSAGKGRKTDRALPLSYASQVQTKQQVAQANVQWDLEPAAEAGAVFQHCRVQGWLDNPHAPARTGLVFEIVRV